MSRFLFRHFSLLLRPFFGKVRLFLGRHRRFVTAVALFAAAVGLTAAVIATTAVVTAALLGSIIKKPVAVTLLLLILFPWQLVPVMLGAAALGGLIDLPRLFGKSAKAE